MKTKTKKILAFAAGLALLVGVLWFAMLFVGNPVSSFAAKRNAKRYLAQQYPGTDYQIEEVSYNFKFGEYMARVTSPSSKDSRFTLTYDWAGNLKQDDYDWRVQQRENTYERLDWEYRQQVETVLKNPEKKLPYELQFGFGTLFTTGDMLTQEPFGLEGLDKSALELDGEYDVNQLARRYGRLVVAIRDNTVTPQRAAQLILDIKNRMDEANAAFCCMDFRLAEKKTDEKEGTKAEEISILSVPYDEIEGEGLEGRVSQWEEETQQFYAVMDKEKGLEQENG